MMFTNADRPHSRTRPTLALALLAGLATASTALAGPGHSTHASGSTLTTTTTTNTDPEGGLLVGGGGGGDNRVVVSVTDGREVKITQKDGKTTVEIDGKVIPADRVKIADGWVSVTDENGKELSRVIMGRADAAHALAPVARAYGAVRGLGGMGDGEGQGFAFTVPESAPPKVMVGITTTAASSDLLEHLGSDAKGGLVVGSVVPESPAEAAGLKKGDLIVSVNGDALVESGGLREKIRDKNPGEEITLSVFQRGQRRDVTVKLAAFDSKKFAVVAPLTNVPTDVDITGEMGMGQDDQAALSRDLRALAERLRNLQGMDEDAVSKLRLEAQRMAEAAAEAAADDRRNVIVRRYGGMNPGAGAGQAPMVLMDRAGGDGRLQRLEERMERIESLLERLEKRLDGKP